MKTEANIETDKAPGQLRAVRLMTAGEHCFGVFSDEIETIADWRAPAPLPDAPPSVLGVTSLRGHMFTLLDSTVLLGQAPTEFEKIVALRGDEQLALAVSSTGKMIEINPDGLEGASEARPLVLGIKSIDAQAVPVLNLRHLFAVAMRGRERRRRRF
jgi:chemotaxis signal transduction protein